MCSRAHIDPPKPNNSEQMCVGNMLVSDAGRLDTRGQRPMQSIYLVASPRYRGRVVVPRNDRLVIAVATVISISPLIHKGSVEPSANRGVIGGTNSTSFIMATSCESSAVGRKSPHSLSSELLAMTRLRVADCHSGRRVWCLG